MLTLDTLIAFFAIINYLISFFLFILFIFIS
nr:MAG TPA: hypothetical protein [Caudoviricetes sp.]